KAVTLEGLEVIFIVIATGAGGLLAPAAVGAALAGSLVILAGLGLRRPVARVPENTLKFAVGVLLSAFGVFWVGEGRGFPWPGEGAHGRDGRRCSPVGPRTLLLELPHPPDAALQPARVTVHRLILGRAAACVKGPGPAGCWHVECKRVIAQHDVFHLSRSDTM